MTFTQKTLQYVHPGHKVLDLGAGSGWFARECHAQQAVVTAVDLNPPSELHQDIDWQTGDVRDFVERLPKMDMFDLIFSRNLIQFLDTAWVEGKLFPTLIQHLQLKGVIAIQTFYRDPEPPFERKVSSLFTVTDLKRMLFPVHVLHEREFSEKSKDMKGVPRKFFVTNIIAQKI